MLTLRRILLFVGVVTQVIAEELSEKEWWETALVYQIWPRAFQDSDGDGEGDLQGIIQRLDYIKDLGVDAIWLNPIYQSPLVDSGYDITDHNKIHPIFGDAEDIDSLIEEAHERDLKVILDIVPNHSSIEHLWFNLSQTKVDPYDDFYIWANGTIDESGEKVEPNNWVSFYDSEINGSAWTWDSIREQWYYHKFHYTQPDLNLRNEDVVQKIMETLDFWLERGVDGFYFSAASYYFEDEHLNAEFDSEEEDDNENENKNENENEKENENENENEDEDEDENDKENKNVNEIKNENLELLFRFREHVDNWIQENNSTSKLLIAGSDDPDEDLISYYSNDSQTGILPFNFRLITTINNSSNAEDIKNTIEEWMGLIPENATTNWVLTNHDHSRTPSRLGLEEVDGFQILNLLLPGQAFTYYGEEIAMTDTQISWNETMDPMGCENSKENYENFSRDPARTPMQWNSSTSAGFSSSEDTFLPVNPSFEKRNVEEQLEEPFSNINIYKKVAFLRKKNPVFTHGGYELETLNENRILVLKRFLQDHPTYIIVINLESSNETVNLTLLYPELEDNLEVVISTDPDLEATEIEGSVLLSGNEAVVLLANKSTTFNLDDEESNDTISTTAPDEGSTTLNSDVLSSLTFSNEKGVLSEEIDEKTTSQEDRNEDEEIKSSATIIFQKQLGFMYCCFVLMFWNF